MESTNNTAPREISRGTVALYKEFFGRGPTDARTHISGDTVTIILGESLLVAEKRLVAEGNASTVRQIRRDFQHSMREPLTALVEGVLGRKVLCLLSDHSPDPDYAAEVFVLEPKDDPPRE